MDEDANSRNVPQESKAGYVLSNVAEVVERILTFVPTKSLFQVASVSRLWRNCARRVLRTQQKLTWLSASGTGKYDEHILLRKLSEELENIYLLPQAALLMVDSENFNLHDDHYKQKKARKCREEEDGNSVERLRCLFPQNCDILGIVTPGVVLTPGGFPSKPPEEHEDGEAGFGLLFPSIEGINIRPFHFCRRTLNAEALQEAGLVGNPELRVVLLFGYEAYKSGAARFLHELLKPLANSNALIAGGHVEKVFSPPRKCCSQGSFGVVGFSLSGPRIQGASVLLEQDVSTPEAAEATLLRLKAANIPEKNTIGFMFACVGRGHNYYNGKRNVEADTFRKVFPTVPLFGFFGNGEIGCDRIIKDKYSLSETDADGLQHGYTTVMSLVHLG
ncbi:F-box only protein 22 [Chanos chanos]|uniref:F-box only protein 22 n=1 Tax=Chanos chanos TaxID=29144 RepID=A0A6J2US16_CHACN|nr:F-box only protein 22 [Chanos chanos]